VEEGPGRWVEEGPGRWVEEGRGRWWRRAQGCGGGGRGSGAEGEGAGAVASSRRLLEKPRRMRDESLRPRSFGHQLGNVVDDIVDEAPADLEDVERGRLGGAVLLKKGGAYEQELVVGL